MEERKRFSAAELRVGIFVIVAGVFLAVAIFMIGSTVGLFQETFYSRTYLNNVSSLKPGDIVNIDITTIVNGWLGDQSETFLIGEVSQEARAVTQCAFDCLYLGIDAIRPNDPIANIGRAIQQEAYSRGYSVVREYVGHGIGRRFHQEPSIPHYPCQQARIQRIEPGICFTIEPMINVGARQTQLDQADGWTVSTKDGKLSAQFEHTILMTENGPEILTLTEQGPQKHYQF